MTEQAPDQKALDAAKAEATGKRLEDGSVVVPLVTDEGTVDILIPSPAMWYEGAVEALRSGRISDWVTLAVDDVETLTAWRSVRKRYRDLDAFLTAWSQATGERAGESPGSRAS